MNDLIVVVGEHNLKVDGDEQAFHDVKEIIIHKNFDVKSFENDLALIILIKPVTFSKKVGLIKLPNENMTDLRGEIATVLGWGLNEHQKVASSLQEIKMEILSERVCLNTFALSRTKINGLTSNHICALSEKSDSATCKGDSGGKLIP